MRLDGKTAELANLDGEPARVGYEAPVELRRGVQATRVEYVLLAREAQAPAWAGERGPLELSVHAAEGEGRRALATARHAHAGRSRCWLVKRTIIEETVNA